VERDGRVRNVRPVLVHLGITVLDLGSTVLTAFLVIMLIAALRLTRLQGRALPS
jgi:predicted amino acid-binding ACT domain protein